MGTVEVIKKFIESNWIIEKAAREILERLPVRFRYGISYGQTFRYWLGFLKESERWDRDGLEAYQTEQARDLLMHAAGKIPYYKKLFSDYEFNPQKFQCLDDLKVLPYLDREIVRDRAQELVDQTIPQRKLMKTFTSGSMGFPLTLYTTKQTEEIHWATVVDLWRRMGYHPRARLVSFQNITFGKERPPFKKFANTLVISRYHFSEPSVKRLFAMIRKFKPEFIYGFPSHLTYFSLLMERSNESPFEGIKAVLMDSEGISEWQRKIVARMFDARVFLSYGMAEKVLYGGPCNFSNDVHLYPQYGIAETSDANDCGTEIIGTGLVNEAMPLIRYRTSDIGKIGGLCEKCHRSYPLIQLIEGRTGDFLVDRHGNILSTLMIGTRSGYFENVAMCQFYQEEKGKALLRIVRRPAYSDNDTVTIRNELRKELEITNNFDIEIAFVEDLERSPAGKTRFVVQKMNFTGENTV